MTIRVSMPPWPVPGRTASWASGNPLKSARVCAWANLLVAVADHDERRPAVAGQVGFGERRLLTVHPVELGLDDGKCSGP